MAARNGNGKYQLLARLRAEEYQALRDDIAKRGVLVPVEVDKDSGAILDGHHRSEIAQELGIRYRTIKRRFDSEKERQEHILKINLESKLVGSLGTRYGRHTTAVRVNGAIEDLPVVPLQPL